MMLSSIVRDQIARTEMAQAQSYADYHRHRIEVIDPSDVAPIGEMAAVLNGPQGSIQVLPTATYLQWGVLSLRYWANQYGVFSVPTTELAEWLAERLGHYCVPLKSVHEIGCGNGALAKRLGFPCSDARNNQAAQAISQSLGGQHAKPPRWVSTREGTAAAIQYRPKVVLAQWVTAGGGTPGDISDGRNGYGPDYRQILKHCDQLIYIGNDAVHGDSLDKALPPCDILYQDMSWLLSRSANQKQNFIKIWRGTD